MTQVPVAVLMWSLVASLLILRRGRTDRSITYAALAIAVAMTLNVDAIYVIVDPLLGGTNFATFISDALLMTGLFYLGRATMKAGQYRPRLVRAAVGRPALLTALVGITVTFLLIDRGSTTTVFMIDLGAQLATAVYSIIVFTYCGIVVVVMFTLAGRQFWHGQGIQRVPSGLLLTGSAAAIALCVVVIVMDIAHVSGNLGLMYAVDPAYNPLSGLAFLFLCAGFASQPVARFIRNRSRHIQTVEILKELEPTWRRATFVRPGLSNTNEVGTHVEDPEGRLHRKIVEIRDAMIDPRVTFEVTGPELAVLQRAENHLLGLGGRESRTSSTDPSFHEPEQGHV